MTMRMMILASAGLLALAACSGGHKEEEILTENGEEANVTVTDTNVTAPPVVIENATNVTIPAAPPPAFTDEQQMRDDADASGLTARLPDDNAQPAQGGNEVR
jgi:ABC-type glycerol-3-phosphate transport system substrate-binding protein